MARVTEASDKRLQISVVWAEKDRCLQRDLRVEAGTTAAQAVQQSGLLQQLQLAPEQLAGVGVWGRRLDGKQMPSAEQYQVGEGDRIELYRPLPLSPMELRRLRAKSARTKRD